VNPSPVRVTGRLGMLAGALVVLAAVASACQERLTSPGECPQLCPGGEIRTFDVVLAPRTGLDSTYTGYNNPSTAFALLVSNGLAASENRAAYRMAARQDTIMVDDTGRSYTVDSVALALTIEARDTLVNGLKLILYRISDTVNATATFSSLDAQLIPANVIDTLVVPDTMNKGLVRTVLRGADLAKVDLPIAGNGILALGVSIAADQPTGVRLGSARAGSGASFTTYVTVDVADTTTSVRKQSRTLSPTFNTFVTQTPLLPDPPFLTVGGDSASRTLIRFALPAEVTDSANIVRATLELIPRGPIPGLRGDIAILEGRAVLADLGAKSPVVGNDNPRFIVDDTLAVNSADTVRLDVTRIVQLWQSSTTQPDAIFLSLLPEASTFTRAEFGSTRSDPAITPSTTEPVGAPRLLITYQRPFPFENP
jgi:hypothetical protein